MKKILIIVTAVLAIIVAVIVVVLKPSNNGMKYKVEYLYDCKDHFLGAEDSYYAGETVKLIFDAVGTDTSYSFYVDGKKKC